MVKNKNKPVTVKRLWKKVDLNDVGDTTFHDLPPQVEPDDRTTPYQYFKMFVTDELLDIVKEQTNLYSSVYWFKYKCNSEGHCKIYWCLLQDGTCSDAIR